MPTTKNSDIVTTAAIDYADYGAAAVLLSKQAAEVSLSYEMRGRLVVSPRGYVLLEVPNDIGNGAFKALHVPGAEQPVSSTSGRYNAHISVIRPEELESIGGASALKERGNQFGFTLGPSRLINNPAGWTDVAKCWVLEARSPALQSLRRAYGLGEPKYPFHITFAIKKRKQKTAALWHPALRHLQEDKTAAAVIRNQPLTAKMQEKTISDPICPHCNEVMAEKHFVPDQGDNDLWRHRGTCYDKGPFKINWPARPKEEQEWLDRVFSDMPAEKKANAEEAIVKGLREAVSNCPRDAASGFLDLWYDMTAGRAVLNFGDWATSKAIEQWKKALQDWGLSDIEVADEAGGPGKGDFIKIASLRQSIQDARDATATPKSPEQASAGNYAKGKVRMHGFTVSLENPKGSTRSGVDPAGKEWSVKMKHDYGYILGTEGRDGDHVDVFIGSNPETELVFVVDQQSPTSMRFDEHKCMLGFLTAAAAKAAYLANFEDGWKGLRNITALTIPQFRWWLANGDTTKPLAGVNVKAAADQFYRKAIQER